MAVCFFKCFSEVRQAKLWDRDNALLGLRVIPVLDRKGFHRQKYTHVARFYNGGHRQDERTPRVIVPAASKIRLKTRQLQSQYQCPSESWPQKIISQNQGDTYDAAHDFHPDINHDSDISENHIRHAKHVQQARSIIQAIQTIPVILDPIPIPTATLAPNTHPYPTPRRGAAACPRAVHIFDRHTGRTSGVRVSLSATDPTNPPDHGAVCESPGRSGTATSSGRAELCVLSYGGRGSTPGRAHGKAYRLTFLQASGNGDVLNRLCPSSVNGRCAYPDRSSPGSTNDRNPPWVTNPRSDPLGHVFQQTGNRQGSEPSPFQTLTTAQNDHFLVDSDESALGRRKLVHPGRDHGDCRPGSTREARLGCAGSDPRVGCRSCRGTDQTAHGGDG